MADETVLAPHIVSSPGHRGGKPRIEGHGLTVAFIASLHERFNVSVAEICAEYDLVPAEVHAALAYYYDHREAIDAVEADDAAWVEQYAREHPSQLGARQARGA